MNNSRAVEYANRLEGILRKYLKCHYTEFGVKANDNLLSEDWKSPINFALGFRYASSDMDETVREDIEDFLGNQLIGKSIGDIISRYDYYAYESEEEAYKAIEQIINRLQEILDIHI